MNERRMSLGNRVISLVLALVMVIGMMPAGLLDLSVFAADSSTSTTATSVEAIRNYASSMLNTNFSKAASENSESKDDKFTWDTEGKTTNWRYYNGVMLDALLMLGVDSNAGNALEFAKDFSDTNTENSDSKAVTWFIAKELDSVPPALVLFDLLDTAEVSESDRAIYAKAINYVYKQLENQTDYSDCGGNYLHKDSWTDWQIGLDGIYMAQPFLMEYAHALEAGKITNTVNSKSASDIYKEVYDRLMWVADNMYDSNTGLYHHGWNVDDSKGNGHFWSRGIGWYAAGLVMCIDLMPAGSYKNDLIGKLPKLFDGMIKYQDDSTGLWYNVVNRDSSLTSNNGNKLETSGTALMAFAIMKAVNKGWVTDSKYATAGLAAINGIVANKMSGGKINDIYKSSGVCTSDGDYCENDYVSDEAKGVGPVIMAAAEAAKYLGGTEIFTTGVVVAPSDMTIVAGGTVDSSNIKVSLLGNKGTIANGVAGQMTYVVGAANNGKATVTVKNGDATIGTFQVNVVDPAVPAEGEGTLGIEGEAVAAPNAPSFSAGDFVLVKEATDGGTEYIKSVAGEGNYVLVVIPDPVNAPTVGVALKNTSANDSSKTKGQTQSVTISANGTKVTITEHVDLCVWTVDSNNKIHNYVHYIRADSSFLHDSSNASSKTKITAFEETGGYYIIPNGSNRYLHYSNSQWVYEQTTPSLPIYFFKETSSSGDPTPAVYAKLTGSEGLVYTLGKDDAEIISAIKNSSAFSVLVADNEEGTDAETVAMSNSLVTVAAPSGYNANTAGTYNFVVRYDGKELGTIPVVLYDANSNVTNYDVDLSVTPGAIVATVGDANKQLNATVLVSELSGYGSVVKYSGGSDSVATVTEDGLVTIVGEGSTTITATVTAITYDGATYDADDFGTITATIPVVVNAEAVEVKVTYSITGLTVLPGSVTVGDTAQATATAAASDASGNHSYTFSYAISGSGASINASTGAISTTAAGTYTVTATLTAVDGNASFEKGTVTRTATFTVVEPASFEYTILGSNGSALAGQNVTLNAGETYQPTFSVKLGDETVTSGYAMTLQATSNASAVSISGTIITANEVAEDTVVGIRATVAPNTRASAEGTSVDFTVTVKAAAAEEPSGTGNISTSTTTGGTSTEYDVFNGSSNSTKTFISYSDSSYGSESVTYTLPDGTSATTSAPKKMNSDTTISFTADASGTLKLYFSTMSSGESIYLDSTSYTIPSNGILEITNVAKGSHTIKKNKGESQLGYIQFTSGSSTGGTTTTVWYNGTLALDPTTVSMTVGGATQNLADTLSVVAVEGGAPASASGVTVEWTSSNTSVATVDSNGKVTAVGAGTTTITAKLTAVTVNGKEGTIHEDITATATVTVTASTGGTLNNTSVTVTQGNNINLAALTATVTDSNGTTSNVNLAQPGFTFEENGQSININDVDATVGSHSIEVFYNGVSVGTMIVVVNAKAEITDTITYELDTDGIDAGAEYIVVDYLNDEAYALGHNSGSTTEKAYAVTIEGDKVIISASDVATALWTFEAVEGKSGYYYIGNGGYYVKPGGSSVFNTSKTATQVIAYDLPTGQYRVNLGEESKIRDLNVTSTSDWARADQGDVSPVYLYKKVEAQTALTLGDLPVLYIGGTPYQATLNDYVTSVKYNGAAYTDYVIEWSSNDNTVATVSDGVVSAVGGGRTQLVAKLVSVGGTDVSAQNITAETDVTVVVPSVNIGEDLNKFVGDTFTVIPEVLIGSTAPESYELIWTSSNQSVATVDENGNVTLVGDGSAVITAQIKSINGNDISASMTITDSITVNAEVIAITSGELSSDTVTVEVGATADELKAALSGIVLTLTKNNGDKIEVNNATLFEDVDLTAVNTAAGGTYYLDVSYSDPNSDYIFSGTVTVKVFDKSMIEAEGFLTQETNVEYILDTDGIDVNEEYVIVMQNSDGEWVALMNPDASGSGSTKGSSQVVTRIENGNKITVSQNADLVRWLFTNQGESSSNNFTYKTFTVKNNNRYLKGGGDSILGSSSKNIGVWYANDGSGQYYVGTDYSSGKVRALTLSGDSWTRASSAKYPDDTDARVYMYKRSSVGTDYPVGFEVQPDSKTIAEGTYYTVPTSGIQVVVDDTECNDYVIEWSSSDTKVATVDSNGKITAVGEGTATITATLMTADGYKVYSNADNTQGISEEIAITVQADQLTYTLQGSPLTVALGGEPDFSKISLLIDSNLSDDMVIPSDQLVFKYIDAVSKGFDTDVASSSCEVDVYYNGSKVGVVVLKVADNAYDGLDEATSYPEYPNTGAVRMDKTAAGINFNTTGVAKIELNAAGVSSRNPVDVVLIVDVSNSMNWSMDWFVGMTDDEVKQANDAAKTDATKDDKLDMAMLAAQDFAEILMANNVSGSSMNNSITFVTFGGNDKDRGGTSDVDTVVTAFVGEEILANVNNSFQNTKFTGSQTLAIAGTDGNAIVSGGARGNTMYDSAFLEAIDAVNALKIAKAGSVEAYEKSGREVHVIFMTDGAPSHYNGLAHANGNTCDGLYTRTDCSDAEWLAHIQEPNTQATKLYAMVGDFHIVGYDLAHGGYGTHTWAEAELGRVLGGLVENKALDYTLATDTDKLNTFFNELGHSLAYAGTHALVTDIVSEEFVLQTDPIDVDGDGNITLTGDNVVDIAPSIQILERQLVLRTDIGKTLKINGVDTLITEEHLGMYVDGGEDVLATVTFDTSDPADKKAFSSALDYGVDIWNDETNIITGAYFTYSFSSKTFEWNIGNIEDTEIALTYYGYLTGAKNEAGEGGRAEGIYATNEKATLKYINTDNQVVVREYPVPHVAWGSAVVNVRFFLVNKDGEFVNRANVTFDNPANRIFLVNSATYKFDLNTNPESMVPGHINAEAAFIAAGINSQYVLYDDVNMDVTNSTMDNKFGSASIVSGIDKSNTGSLVEFVDVYGDGSYIQTTINIPVILADLGESSQKMGDSSVVIDFSNSVQWDSLGANERLYDGHTVDEQESTIELVGFTTYNPAADLKDYIDYELASPNWKQTYSTAYGTFTLVADNADAEIDDYIQYTPNAPLNGADHVFAVFKFSSHPVGSAVGYMDYYYMYKQVSVVPATVVHYETTGNMAAAFQSSFNGAAWSVQSIAESVAGATQSNKNENYGADTSYNSCVNFAGGSSLFVENTDSSAARPSVKFTFTGTGIDIISKTDPDQGRVKMTLTGKNTGTTKSVMVLNKGVDNLYQIPVLSVEGLPYDTYEVEIVVYSKTSAYGGQFYLDAINVYGSAQETEVVGSTAAGNTTVGSLYEAAGESKPQILEIRDILLGNNNFGDITASGVQGAVYIDGNTTLGDTSTNFNNYDKIGPNNEVYLSNNQAVAFKLRVEELAKLPTTLDIGLKSVNGSAAKAVIYVYKTGASDTRPAEYTVTTATAMFYDILGGEDIKTFLGENNEFYVVIANKGTGTLSVTDLKVGYGVAKGSVETVVDITVGSLTQETLKASAQVVSAAIANMNAETNTAIAYAMYTTTIVVVTGQDAESIVVEDLEGNEIAVNASYVDSDNGARRWRVLVRFNEVGTDTYNIYGIGTNGSRHDTYQQITVDVQLFAPANTN